MRKRIKPGFRFYEYIIYWIVTVAILLLAGPVFIMKFFGYLLKSIGAPFKSARNFLGFLLVLILLAGGYLALLIFYPHDLGRPVRSVMVNKNDTFARVAAELHRSGVIREVYLFKIMARSGGLDLAVAPGRYDFSGKVSMYDVYRKLKRHDITTVLLTVPEGSTVGRTAGILAGTLEIDSALFHRQALDTAWTKARYDLMGLEGYLFPETYRFQFGIEIEDIIDIMVGEFHERTDGLFDNRPDDSLRRDQIITLASIIQAEAFLKEEMPLISSVYHNRLAANMRLQADPTVIYALGGLDRPLYYRDLEIDSPYNTYKYKGLPPGPINSPGLEAIRAALNPASENYFYFVADGSGRHIFTRTHREHVAAKNQIKKNKRQKSND